VGRFRLQEGISQTQFLTNKSFSYSFDVTGIGNFSAVMMPEKLTYSGLEIFPPAIQQRSQKINGQLSGFKRFSYTLLATRPTSLNLGQVFRLVYFDPEIGVYDTLQSELTIRVNGPEEKAVAPVPEETDPFYKLISKEQNTLVSLGAFEEVKLYTNLIILLLICVSLYLFIKK
jgi:hypothetical protein